MQWKPFLNEQGFGNFCMKSIMFLLWFWHQIPSLNNGLQASMETFRPQCWMPFHADALSPVRPIALNSAHNKLHQIYCVCLRKNILLTFFSFFENVLYFFNLSTFEDRSSRFARSKIFRANWVHHDSNDIPDSREARYLWVCCNKNIPWTLTFNLSVRPKHPHAHKWTPFRHFTSIK